jgi:hypothetical protein
VADYGPSVILEELFQISDSAAVLYGEFVTSHHSATWLSRAGALLYLSAPFVSLLAEDDDGRAALYIGLTLGGFGFTLASYPPRRRASRAMSRAMWWYNAELSP